VHLSLRNHLLAIHIFSVEKLPRIGDNFLSGKARQRKGTVMDVQLLIVRGKPQGKSLSFPPGEFVFGCGAECHVRSNTAWINRQHCLLRVTHNTVYLRDLGSSTGTLVNGCRLVGERQLWAGDRIQLGPVVLEMQPQAGKGIGLLP
jgi:hypothetical protein